jgi:hypothetical protein
MYLHSRNCKADFVRLVRENRHKFSTAVVHSYTGDEEELNALLEMGLYIGVNGCSLKTLANIEVVKKIPLDRIMLESIFNSRLALLRNQEQPRGCQVPQNQTLPIQSQGKVRPGIFGQGKKRAMQNGRGSRGGGEY